MEREREREREREKGKGGTGGCSFFKVLIGATPPSISSYFLVLYEPRYQFRNVSKAKSLTRYLFLIFFFAHPDQNMFLLVSYRYGQ